MTHIVLSKKRCLPCRQLHDILVANNLNWETKWHHEDPKFFEMLGVKSAPTLLKMTGLINGYKHYKVVAVGLPDIQKYMNNNFNNNEEEE
tara:strand:- start:38364 stop:38633 length:270 start_codon:yes stop_codon:yes gene_type:complete